MGMFLFWAKDKKGFFKKEIPLECLKALLSGFFFFFK